MDRVIIDDITFYAYHGILPGEKELGQEFTVNIELGIDLETPFNDRIEDVADYRKAISAAETVMLGEPCQLLETLACRIADKILQIPGIMETTVEVRKSNPPVPGLRGGVSVLVTRTRKD